MTPFYLTITRLKGVDYIEERKVDEATWERTLHLLGGGEIAGELIGVLHVDPEAGRVKDMGVAVAYELSRISREEKIPLPAEVVAYVAEKGFDGYEPGQDATLCYSPGRLAA